MSNSARTKISIVLPCFNEEEVIGQTIIELESLAGTLSNYTFEFIFVDDGSTDNTLNIILNRKNALKQVLSNFEIRIINFKFNQGHMNALKEGYKYSKGDLIITLDADLQDPPSVIPEMIEKILAQNLEVVQAVRVNRKVDSYFKRITAKLYYRVIRIWSGVEIVPNAADFRIVTSAAKDRILFYSINKTVFRLLIPSLNLNTDYLYFTREERFAGKTKYNLRSMLRLTVDSLLTFSSRPLRLVSVFGFLFSIFFFLCFIATIILSFLFDTVPGWTSVVALLLLGSAIPIAILGFIGEYIAKIFDMLNKVDLESTEA
jgi:dolichol-phosphate mannosyltransferase